jgi:molecular chaperone HscA
MRISVFQGERDLVKDNRKLAEFNLTGIPGMPAGMPKVEVSFLINADGILSVHARELRSGVEQSIEVKPQYGLTDEEVEHMLLESITHAQDDIRQRSLIETVTEGEQIIDTTENFIRKNGMHLEQEEITRTNRFIRELKEVMSSGNKDAIHARIEALNEYTRPFAERIMDIAVSAAMKGRKI